MDSYSDLIQVGTAVATTLATFVIIYYAKKTIDEGKRNRRKDTVERMLEELYSPLYEILRRAKFGKTEERQEIRQSFPEDPAPGDYFLKPQEVTQIRDLLGRFGHYVDTDDQDKLTKAFEGKHKIGTKIVDGHRSSAFRFPSTELDPLFQRIVRNREQLKSELRDLTKV